MIMRAYRKLGMAMSEKVFFLFCAIVLVITATFMSPISTVTAKSDLEPVPTTISVDEIKPGMTGYGLTVLKGTDIVRFDIEVVGVLRKVLSKQDLILVKCSCQIFKTRRQKSQPGPTPCERPGP